jgi:hypothetical protein
MNTRRTADDVARLFAERGNSLSIRLSDKQLTWLTTLAGIGAGVTTTHSHGYNSYTPGRTVSTQWTGTFCVEHNTRWTAHHGGDAKWLAIEPCSHRPARTSSGTVVVTQAEIERDERVLDARLVQAAERAEDVRVAAYKYARDTAGMRGVVIPGINPVTGRSYVNNDHWMLNEISSDSF